MDCDHWALSTEHTEHWLWSTLTNCLIFYNCDCKQRACLMPDVIISLQRWRYRITNLVYWLGRSARGASRSDLNLTENHVVSLKWSLTTVKEQRSKNHLSSLEYNCNYLRDDQSNISVRLKIKYQVLFVIVTKCLEIIMTIIIIIIKR